MPAAFTRTSAFPSFVYQASRPGRSVQPSSGSGRYQTGELKPITRSAISARISANSVLAAIIAAGTRSRFISVQQMLGQCVVHALELTLGIALRVRGESLHQD